MQGLHFYCAQIPCRGWLRIAAVMVHAIFLDNCLHNVVVLFAWHNGFVHICYVTAAFDVCYLLIAAIFLGAALDAVCIGAGSLSPSYFHTFTVFRPNITDGSGRDRILRHRAAHFAGTHFAIHTVDCHHPIIILYALLQLLIHIFRHVCRPERSNRLVAFILVDTPLKTVCISIGNLFPLNQKGGAGLRAYADNGGRLYRPSIHRLGITAKPIVLAASGTYLIVIMPIKAHGGIGI